MNKGSDYPQGQEWFSACREQILKLHRGFGQPVPEKLIHDWLGQLTEVTIADLTQTVESLLNEPDRRFAPRWGEFKSRLPKDVPRQPRPGSVDMSQACAYDLLSWSFTGNLNAIPDRAIKWILAEADEQIRLDERLVSEGKNRMTTRREESRRTAIIAQLQAILEARTR